MDHNFEFVPQGALLFDGWVINVPRLIADKSELFATYRDLGRFPSYAANNWDSFEECISDFSWINKKQISIVHADLPLEQSREQCMIYIRCLRTAVAETKIDRAAPTEKVLPVVRVFFPDDYRESIENLLCLSI